MFFIISKTVLNISDTILCSNKMFLAKIMVSTWRFRYRLRPIYIQLYRCKNKFAFCILIPSLCCTRFDLTTFSDTDRFEVLYKYKNNLYSIDIVFLFFANQQLVCVMAMEFKHNGNEVVLYVILIKKKTNNTLFELCIVQWL